MADSYTMGRYTTKVKGISRVITSVFTSSPDFSSMCGTSKLRSLSGAQFLHLLNGINITDLIRFCEDELR